MKHELTTEQIKTLAEKAPELKAYLKELAPDAFEPELIEFKSGLVISPVCGAALYIGIGDAPDHLRSKCLMWNKSLFKVNIGSHMKDKDELGYLTIARL